MKRKIKLTESPDLHEIKNKKRIRPIEVKKKGVRLAHKRKWKKSTKLIASASALAILALGAFTLGSAFFGEAKRNVVDLDYGSVVYELSEGETYTDATAADYSAIDIFGRLNWKFMQQTKWFGEMHGIVSVPMIGMEQDVTTYKQYDNNILISADLTKSSMVNAARQFCYVKEQDRVIWREAADKKKQDGLDTVWKTGKPYRTMTISGADGFKAQNGLPAYELSVYVIEPDSVLSSGVESNGDATYTVSFDLKPENWIDDGVTKGATAYYINQMIFTGGLPAAPTFSSLSVSFTYNSDWEVLYTTVNESYSAQYGPISAPCISESSTVYEYNTARAESSAFDEYFSQYLEGPVENGAAVKDLEATDYLVAAFGDVLAGPASLSLDLDLNGSPLHGVVYLDISGLDLANLDLSNLDLGGLAARIKLGDTIDLWLDGGVAYVRYGGMKVSLSVSELLDMLLPSSAHAASPMALVSETGTEEEDDLLGAIVNGELVKGEGTAELHCVLPLLGLDVGVDFYFYQDENNNVTLNYVSASLPLDGFPVGVRATYTEEEAPALSEEEKPSYVALLPYVKQVMGLLDSGAFDAEISYAGEDFSVGGKIAISVSPFAVNGAVTLTLDRPEPLKKTVAVAMADNVVYLDLDGIRLSAGIDDAVELITRFLADDGAQGTEKSDGTAASLDVSAILGKVLSPGFASLLTVSEEEGALRLAVKGTELLQAFGIDFALGDAVIGVGEDGIFASVLGADVRVTGGEPFTVDGTGYIDILPYANTVADLLTSKSLTASLTLTGGKLAVEGTVGLDLKTLSAKADLSLTYDKLQKDIGILFGRKEGGGDLFLSLDGLKLKVDVAEGVEIVKSLLPASSQNDTEAAALLDALFGLDFGEVILPEETDGVLSLTLKGTDLLGAFGVDFALGDVGLTLSDDRLSVHAANIGGLGYGIALHIEGGDGFDMPATEDYVDVTPVLKEIPSLLEKKAVSVDGSLTLTVAGAADAKTAVTLDVTRGVVSWADGLDVYLDAVLAVGSSAHEISLSVQIDPKDPDPGDAETAGAVGFAYGGVGAKLAFSDLDTLEDALLDVYNRVRGIVSSALGNPASGNPLGDADAQSLSEILDLLKGALSTAKTLDETSKLDWQKLVGSIVIGGAKGEGGIASLGYGGFSVDILSELTKGGLLGLNLGYENEKKTVALAGDLHAAVYEGKIPELPEGVDYLGAADIADFIDYLGAAVGLIAEPRLTVNIDGSIYDGNAEKYPGGVKYNVNAKVEYDANGKFPFVIRTDEKTFTVDPDVYLRIGLSLAAQNAADTSVYLDLLVLDANTDGSEDDILDFYITVSTVAPIGTAEGTGGYKPLSAHVTADELMTILSGACAMLGVDVDIVNDYLIGQWVKDTETVAQLRAFGFSLKEMINDLLGVEIFKNEEETGVAAASLTEEGEGKAARRGFIKSVKKTEGGYEITLDSRQIYGDDRDDIVFTLQKTKDEAGLSHLSAIAFTEISDRKKSGGASFSITVDNTSAVTRVASPKAEYDFVGIDDLILSFAKSATHLNRGGEASGAEGKNEYILNRNFYVDGTITLDLSLISSLSVKSVNIGMALSVDIDEQGDVGFTVHIEYAKESIVVDIFKSAGWVDLTIKNKMVYIKRITDPSDANKREEIYRIMPLDNFMSDILNQVDFIFNFGSVISDALKNAGGGSSSGGGTAETQDVGALIGTYLSSYIFKRGEGEKGGNLWKVAINGEGLAPGVLSNIDIDIKSDDKNILRTLDVATSVASVLNLKASLRLRNPQGQMDTDAQDVVDHTVQETLDRAMGGTFSDPAWSWEETVYLEGKLGTFTYVYGDQVLSTQYVVYDTKTGKFFNAEYEYPSFALLPDPGETYHYEWVLPQDTTSHNQRIEAKLTPNHYHITLKSEYELAGYDDVDGTWVKTFDYAYGATGLLGIGTEYIDEAQGIAKRLRAFRCSDGHEITELTAWQHFTSTSDEIELMAVWEDIYFTVTFDVDGVLYPQQVKYGEAAVEPEESVKNAKTGYTFQNWDGDISQLIKSEGVVFRAVYAPNHYTLTFVSEHEITDWEGLEFVLQETGDHVGKYVATYDFVYDSAPFVLKKLKSSDKSMIIDSFIANGENYYDVAPNVHEDTEFTVVWVEVGVEIKFEADGKTYEELTRNAHVGDSIDEKWLPAVPAKNGFEGRWNVDIESYTVPAEGDTIVAEYTPIVYTVLEYSLYAPYQWEELGFKKVEGPFDDHQGVTGSVYYVRTLYYKYTSGKVYLDKDCTQGHEAGTTGKDTTRSDYDLVGFFTERFGQGISAATIDDRFIEKLYCFNGESDHVPPVGNEFAIYAHWKNITITVRYYSDVKPAGQIDGTTTMSQDGQTYMMYYVNKPYNRATAVDYTPEAENGKSRFLAWFYQDETGWRRVTDVEEFRVTEGDNAAVSDAIAYDVALYAVWIEEIKLNVSSVEKPPFLVAFTRYEVSGTVEGGFPVAGKSSEIFVSVTGAETIAEAVESNRSVDGQFVIYGKKGLDTLDGGNVTKVTQDPNTHIGSLATDGALNSGNYATGDATHGGIAMQMVFSFDNVSIKLFDLVLVSFDTYTVRFLNIGGDAVRELKEIRLNCTAEFTTSNFKNKFDLTGTVKSSAEVYADELAAANGIECPQEGAPDGKTAIWPHRKLVESMAVETTIDVEPAFASELQTVTYRSETDLDGAGGDWVAEYNADGTPTGKFLYSKNSEKVYVDAEITFVDASGVIEGYTYTVVAGENIVDLPAASEIRAVSGIRLGKWTAGSYSYDPWGVTFNAEYGQDEVVYHSAIECDVAGYKFEADASYRIPFGSEYTLFTPTNETHTFLGWFAKQADGTWKKIETLQIAAEETTTYVEALWVENSFSVTIESASKKWDWGTKYSAKVTASGGALKGAAELLEAASVKMTFKHFVNDGANDNGDGNMRFMLATNAHDAYTATDEISNITKDSKDYYHCSVTWTYSVSGEAVHSETRAADKKV